MKALNLLFLVSLFAVTTLTQAQIPHCEATSFQFESPELTAAQLIKVQSDSAQMIQKNLAYFKGNVVINSPEAIINAQEAQINDNGKKVLANGDVSYTDKQLQVFSSSVEVDTSIKLLQMADSEYELSQSAGRGAAEILSLSGENGLRLEDVSFTTCPKGGEDWKIYASEIIIGKDEAFGEAKNTIFYLSGIPVFYLPYFAFPVTPERQSGFLFPKIGSSDSAGLDVETPFYWNIAPNYDVTISPRLMTERGLQLKTEFRYLKPSHRGEMQVEYMARDEDTIGNIDRYFYRWSHQGNLSENWHLNINYSDISDDNYIVDLGSDYYSRSDTHLYKQLGVNYYSDNVDFSLQFRDFEVIGDHPDVYRALPEAKFAYNTNIHPLIQFKLQSELAYFENALENKPTAVRWHVEPSLTIPYQRPWGELLAEISVLNTYYQQDIKDSTTLAEEVNRTIGQGRLYGTLLFEKNQSFLGKDYQLTFEPKAQYLYTSYEDQQNIGLYDTTALLITFNNLFRGQEFTGLDRINDNNQVTFGFTSRLIDPQNREKLVFSLGQIFYLKDAQLISSVREESRSALAAELDWQLNQRWFLHSDIQIATQTDKVERSSIATEYRISENKLIQFNHRFVRNLSGEKIDQFGVTASWPINNQWHWVGRWYRDAERSRTAETFFGVQYESCCWALRMTAQRSLSSRFDVNGNRSIDDFDSGIAMQFTFRGLGNSRRKVDLLEDGLFGYRQPYLLN